MTRGDDIEISVVMGVHNGEASLAETLASILSQEACSFEFIVVDDGSTDGSARILAEFASRDARLRVLSRSHAGLTAALTTGCAQARGRYIARQDCGDRSLPGRLARQRDLLDREPDTVMVACAVRFLGPAGEHLFVSKREGSQLHEGLRRLDVASIQGPPHHGATMFRTSAYRQAGGYRNAFPVAQDLDLWLRLCELGACAGDPHLGYEARLEFGGIGTLRREEQLQFGKLAIECALRRAQGLAEDPLLAAAPPRAARGRAQPRDRANFFYFIASCLRRNDRASARSYYWRAFREDPRFVKGLLRAALTLLP